MLNVLVLGYGWSGSSAVVDLLKEYNCTYTIPVEFRLIKDPYGLMDLRYNLIDRWDPLNYDIAIKDFLWFTNCLYRKSSKMPTKVGLDYKESIGKAFRVSTNNFINSIAPTIYKGDWHFLEFKDSSFNLFGKKAISKIFKKSLREYNMYYSSISGGEFDYFAKEYIKNIFSRLSENKEMVIYDQAIPTQMPLEAIHYFDNYKIIIVDRDPRDIYCDLIASKGFIGEELSKTNDTDFYSNWFNRFREKRNLQLNGNNILLIPFENLVFESKTYIQKIETFLNISPSCHINKSKYFIPTNSRQNVGLWKKYPNQKAISQIKNNLAQYINKYAN